MGGVGESSSPRCVGRNASVFLVRCAQGGTLDEAAQFLGISAPGKNLGFTGKLNHYLRSHSMLHDFELALDAITADLHATPLVDYRRRREALNSWVLEPHAWQRMVTALPVLPGHRASLNDDRKRLAVRSTSGPGSPKANTNSRPPHRTLLTTRNSMPSGADNGITSATGSGNPTNTRTTWRSNRCSTPTWSNSPEQSTRACRPVGDNKPALGSVWPASRGGRRRGWR